MRRSSAARADERLERVDAYLCTLGDVLVARDRLATAKLKFDGSAVAKGQLTKAKNELVRRERLACRAFRRQLTTTGR